MTERPELPLFAHAARKTQADDVLRARQNRRSRLRRRGAIAASITAAAIAPISVTIVRPPLPRLVWNASASAPIGLYTVSPGVPIGRGDMVVAWAPLGPRRLAAKRHYLPVNVPLVKRVAAIRGDRVCATGTTIRVNGRPVVIRKKRDAAGLALPWWNGCVTLRYGALLLLNDPPNSFDGRYFGPTERCYVIGKATPIWVR